MSNGGVIGRRNVPGVDGFSGVWSLREIANATRSGLWSKYAFEVLKDNPTAYWRVSEGRLVDIGPSRIDIGLPTGVTPAAGLLPGDGAGSLNFAAAYRIALHAGTWAPTGNANRSMETWLTTTASPGTSDTNAPGLLGYGGTGVTRASFYLRPAVTADATPADQAYKAWVWADDLIATGATDWNTGSAVHVVVTYNGGTRALKVYTNGTLAGSRTLGANLVTAPNTTFYIGGNATGIVWTGNMQEMAVYDTELSSTRVLDHYNTGIAA